MVESKVRRRPARRFSVASSLAAVVVLLAFAANYGALASEVPTSSSALRKYQTPWNYSTNDEIGAFAQRMGREYPEYCNAYTIGESVLGNKLWVLTVSKEASHFSSPDYTPSSLSPSFLYIGNMHGDEPLGRQLMVYLAEELCSQAGKGKDLVVDRIVESGSVHLLFSMNPDGFDQHTRENAHKVDLNRNFPDPILQKGEMNLTGEEEPETLNFMKYVARMGDSLMGMTTLHEGANIFILPWDGNRNVGTKRRMFNPAPDYEMLYQLGKRYADLQPKFQNNREFPQAPEGVLNGADWYPLWGGIQDWTYIVHKIYGTTIEMNDEKWPAESELEGLWRQHRRSMYALLVAYVCEGLTVEVDFAPGSPEEEVTVTMLNQQMGRPVKFKSSTLHGVHYPVPEGQYSVRVDWESGESSAHTLDVPLGLRSTLTVEKPSSSTPVDVNVVVPPVDAAAESESRPVNLVEDSIEPSAVVEEAAGSASNHVAAIHRHPRSGSSEKRDILVMQEQQKQQEPKPVMFIYIRNFSIIVTIVLILFINVRKRRRTTGQPRSSSHLSNTKIGQQWV